VTFNLGSTAFSARKRDFAEGLATPLMASDGDNQHTTAKAKANPRNSPVNAPRETIAYFVQQATSATGQG
jgi:hypothetical protein